MNDLERFYAACHKAPVPPSLEIPPVRLLLSEAATLLGVAALALALVVAVAALPQTPDPEAVRSTAAQLALRLGTKP